VFDLDAEWARSVGDQRHRAVVNGIWQPGFGFQLSGLYFYSSGPRFSNNYGGDLRNTGNESSGRLRPDGTVVTRNSFVGDPLHRVDFRVQRRFLLGSRVGVDGIVEIFNVFNHENYGAFVTNESNSRSGQPTEVVNTAYQPIMLQLGFRASF
jgi:hypothetical protein